MELDPIAYIDIVQIRAVTGTPALFNKLLLPRTLALMPHEKNLMVRPQWPLCPWPGQCSELALKYSHPRAQ